VLYSPMSVHFKWIKMTSYTFTKNWVVTLKTILRVNDLDGECWDHKINIPQCFFTLHFHIRLCNKESHLAERTMHQKFPQVQTQVNHNN